MTTQRLSKHINNQSRIGDLGESLVATVLNCKMNDNAYDSTSDMVQNITGDTIEVKTQNRFHQLNSFTIPINHLNKCQQVDRLIFVEYGTSGRCRMYECHDRTRFTTYKHKMIAFPIENMSLIWDFEHPAAEEMCELTETKYRQYLNDKDLYNS